MGEKRAWAATHLGVQHFQNCVRSLAELHWHGGVAFAVHLQGGWGGLGMRGWISPLIRADLTPRS